MVCYHIRGNYSMPKKELVANQLAILYISQIYKCGGAKVYYTNLFWIVV
jgi:hypothetical protein